MAVITWGKCASCGNLAEPSHTCRMCNSVFCTKCFATPIGMCRKCGSRVNAGTALKQD